ncbi:MAG: hypothetical protein KGI02_03875 [Thaumarchaeota archaeon]|nr:hypothetical protein [Nitrososphaerota archaeon]MDE1877825.1 hypothetical protein [Nitrososphaerota archaeon]
MRLAIPLLLIPALFVAGLAHAEVQMFATNLTVVQGDTTTVQQLTGPGQVILVNATSDKISLVVQGKADVGSQITIHTDLMDPTIVPDIGLEQSDLPATYQAYQSDVVISVRGAMPQTGTPTLLEITSAGGNVLTVVGTQSITETTTSSSLGNQKLGEFRSEIASSELPLARQQYYNILVDKASAIAQTNFTAVKAEIDQDEMQLNGEESTYSKVSMLVSQAEQTVSRSHLPSSLIDPLKQENTIAAESLNSGDYPNATTYAQDIVTKIGSDERDYVAANQELQKAQTVVNATAMPDDSKKQALQDITCGQNYIQDGDFKQSIVCSDSAIGLTNVPLWQSLEVQFPWLYPTIAAPVVSMILLKVLSKKRQRPMNRRMDFIQP